MRPLTIEEMKRIELEILKDVAKFCDNHQIRYYLGGGTLLGAVRHKGFIPWDDDIDISMPRKDYLRFINSYNNKASNYFVASIYLNADYPYTMAKVFDKRTYLQDNTLVKSPEYLGVFIDVYPIDGLPASEIEQRLLFKEQEFLNILLHGSLMSYTKSYKYNDSFSSFSWLKGVARTFMKYIAIALFRPFSSSKLIAKINSNLEKYDFDSSEYVAAIVDCIHGAACEKIKRTKFEPRIKFKFEDDEFWGPSGYEQYLSNLYGDYMKIPPENRRVSHHNFKAYWKTTEPKC